MPYSHIYTFKMYQNRVG
ncbi:hypothetical protein F383_29097 [Gossypium arboreum]|uniref:Uncharacterized protein n=1 Tax=Gossypium arboreum TaxID=29729 RepID=A0A0B0MS24_GOSAR|nr:hypothetical protein F383_29097 [Gossypium arboreum]